MKPIHYVIHMLELKGHLTEGQHGTCLQYFQQNKNVLLNYTHVHLIWSILQSAVFLTSVIANKI